MKVLSGHHDKTLIGRTRRGFDYLGYFIKPDMVSVAKKTVHNFLKRIARLYEQDADIHRIGQYVRKWVQWVFAGQGMEKVLNGQGKITVAAIPDRQNIMDH